MQFEAKNNQLLLKNLNRMRQNYFQSVNSPSQLPSSEGISSTRRIKNDKTNKPQMEAKISPDFEEQ